MSRNTDGSWNVSSDGFDHADLDGVLLRVGLAAGPLDAEHVEAPAIAPGGRRLDASRGRQRTQALPRQERGRGPAGRPSGLVLRRAHARLEPREVPVVLALPGRGRDHPQIADDVRRADLELVVVVARAVGVEEDLHDLLLPEVLVAARHRVPGPGVVHVVAQEETLVVPERAEAGLVRCRSPCDGRARGPRLLVRGQERDSPARRSGRPRSSARRRRPPGSAPRTAAVMLSARAAARRSRGRPSSGCRRAARCRRCASAPAAAPAPARSRSTRPRSRGSGSRSRRARP